jgi:RNA polymerase sigma-70 factor (ECF subfamily)
MTMALRLPLATALPTQRAEEGDAAMIARAKAGDGAAFEKLYRAHAPRVFALCLRLSADRQRAAELTQDVFVRAWEGLGGFRGESALASWLHRLAVNAHLMMLRSERRRVRRVALEDDLFEPADGPHLELHDSVPPPDIESAIDLERAIARLPVGARTVFVLHEVEGYTHEEIASATGLAAGTLRAHLHRARRLLMEMMTK